VEEGWNGVRGRGEITIGELVVLSGRKGRVGSIPLLLLR
jgi:hypothetical protein